jgi:lipoprotein-releasing system permease protein
MHYAAFIARRHLRSRHHRGFLSFITSIAVLGVALGTAALIIALAVLGGFEREITEKVIGFTAHVQVTGFQNIPLEDRETALAMLEDSIPEVRAAAPFVSREALIRSRAAVDGIILKGVDPVRDVSSVGRYLVEGRFALGLEADGSAALIIGRKLASRMELGVGDRATVFAVDRGPGAGRVRARQFRVAGMYESGMAEYDDIYAYTSLEEAQGVFALGTAVTGYDVQISPVDSAEAVARRAGDLLGYPHYARTVFQNYRNLFTWIELQKQPVPVILGLIIIVATVNIIGTLLMMVLEKMREIGILMAMGADRRGIARIFLRQGMTIAVTGTVAGNLLAFVLLALQLEFRILALPSDIYFMSSVPVLLRPEYFLGVSAVSLLLCLVTSYVPARLAARLNPVTAIRFA